MMMTYAEAVRRPAPVDPEQLKDFNLAQTSVNFFKNLKFSKFLLFFLLF